MLARVAERVYWMARYLERAEDTARLVDVYTSLLLDLPRQIRLGWGDLVRLTGAAKRFAKRDEIPDENTVVRFLLTDAENPSSVISCLIGARENVRTTRDVLPSELWESVNALHQYAHQSAATGPDRGARHDYLSRIVDGGHHINGMLHGSMSRDETYAFTLLGRMLERADMTTRIVDVGVSAVPAIQEAPDAHDGIVWIHVLRALSGYQAYRQRGHLGADSNSVARFLLADATFPRSVRHCVMDMAATLSHLPRGGAAAATAATLVEHLAGADVRGAEPAGLLELSDVVQVHLGALHTKIAGTWFGTETETETDAAADATRKGATAAGRRPGARPSA